jgi:excisionase family DNA binding protein
MTLKQARTYYTVKEFAKLTGRSEYQVREWCKEGKIQAEKTKERRGAYSSWRIPHEERLRITREST